MPLQRALLLLIFIGSCDGMCDVGFTKSTGIYSSNVCIECPPGTYKATTGSGHCTDCGSGEYSITSTRHIGLPAVFTNGPGMRVTHYNQAYCYFTAPESGRLVSWSVNHQGEP